jgi:hypothetical protein
LPPFAFSPLRHRAFPLRNAFPYRNPNELNLTLLRLPLKGLSEFRATA